MTLRRTTVTAEALGLDDDPDAIVVRIDGEEVAARAIYEDREAERADVERWVGLVVAAETELLAREDAEARAEAAQLRQKASRYHRRAQKAEAWVGKTHAEIVDSGPANMGRGFANVAAASWRARAEVAEAEVERLADVERALGLEEAGAPGPRLRILAAAVQLTRERDEARDEVERLRVVILKAAEPFEAHHHDEWRTMAAYRLEGIRAFARTLDGSGTRETEADGG